jgi:hypothetical protein
MDKKEGHPYMTAFLAAWVEGQYLASLLDQILPLNCHLPMEIPMNHYNSTCEQGMSFTNYFAES